MSETGSLGACRDAATKISFINAMAEIAEVTGTDVTQLADAIGHDARIGRRFLGAGIGFGGGCLPKDIRAFSARAEELGRGESVAFLREVEGAATKPGTACTVSAHRAAARAVRSGPCTGGGLGTRRPTGDAPRSAMDRRWQDRGIDRTLDAWESS